MPHLTANALVEDPDGIAFLRDVFASSASNRREVQRTLTNPDRAWSPPVADAHPEHAARHGAVPRQRAPRFGLLRARMPSVPLVLVGALAGLIFVSPALSSKGAPHDFGADGARPVAASKTRVSKSAPKVELAQLVTPCAKTRKSLWVEGQGWVVRRVSVCR